MILKFSFGCVNFMNNIKFLVYYLFKCGILLNILIFSFFRYLDAQTSKPLQFISSYESVKEAANSYGCLEGDFVDMMVSHRF